MQEHIDKSSRDIAAGAFAGETGFTPPVKILLALGILAALAASLAACRHNPVDADELEHLHASWMWAKGLQPYTDFFEHHPPLYWITLRPMIPADARDLPAVLMTVRTFSWVVAALTVIASWGFFKTLLGSKAAWCGAFFLSVQCVVCRECTDVRPDGPSLLLLILGSTLAIRATGIAGNRSAASPPLALLAGLILGLGVCMITKAVFWVTLLILSLLLAAAIGRFRAGMPRYLASVIALIAGVFLAGGGQIIWALSASDFTAFWHHNFTVNRSASHVLSNMYATKIAMDGLLCWPMLSIPLAVLGAARFLTDKTRFPLPLRLTGLALAASGMILILLGNGPFLQYHLHLFVMLAGFAGLAAAGLLDMCSPAGKVISVLGLLATFAFVGGEIVRDCSIPRLAKSLAPFQAMINAASPTDTYQSVDQLTPVFVPNCNPRLYMKRRPFKNDATDLLITNEILADINIKHPRWVIGLRAQDIPADTPALKMLRQELLKSYRPPEGDGKIWERRTGP